MPTVMLFSNSLITEHRLCISALVEFAEFIDSANCSGNTPVTSFRCNSYYVKY